MRFELTSPHYGCGILAAGRPVLVTNPTFAVGSEGLEPSPTWLRARHAAANTLIPCVHPSGAGGIRTHASQIKSLLCCRYTTTPRSVVGAFQPANTAHFLSLRKKDQMSLGVESNHRFRLIRATCFRCTTKRAAPVLFSRDGWNRTSFHVFPKHAGARSPSSRSCLSSRNDSCGI